MDYQSHAFISARKFNCNPEDVLELHKLMDSSKIFFPQGWQHRMFSHNMWFVQVVTDMYLKLTNKDYVKNTKTNGHILIRDILIEHLKEDFSGKIPDLKDWLNCIKFETNEKWINNPDRKEIEWLKNLKFDI